MIESIKSGKYGKFPAWVAKKVDRHPRLKRFFGRISDGIEKRPWLKKTIRWGLVGFAVINIANLVSQYLGYGVFAVAWTRKHTTLRDEYALSARCEDKLKKNTACTVEEEKARTVAWDNDVLMCYGYGAACLAEHFAGRSVPDFKDMRPATPTPVPSVCTPPPPQP